MEGRVSGGGYTDTQLHRNTMFKHSGPHLREAPRVAGVVLGGGGILRRSAGRWPAAGGQGATLVHFSAQLEPCLTQENTHTLQTPP